MICDACDGAGRFPGAAQTQSGPGVTMKCTKCNGKGYIRRDEDEDSAREPRPD